MTYNDSSHLHDDPLGNYHITSSHSHHQPQPQVPTATLLRPWRIPTLNQARQVDTTIATSTTTTTASPTHPTQASCITMSPRTLFLRFGVGRVRGSIENSEGRPMVWETCQVCEFCGWRSLLHHCQLMSGASLWSYPMPPSLCIAPPVYQFC